jgi:hypothetical protein
VRYFRYYSRTVLSWCWVGARPSDTNGCEWRLENRLGELPSIATIEAGW